MRHPGPRPLPCQAATSASTCGRVLARLHVRGPRRHACCAWRGLVVVMVVVSCCAWVCCVHTHTRVGRAGFSSPRTHTSRPCGCQASACTGHGQRQPTRESVPESSAHACHVLGARRRRKARAWTRHSSLTGGIPRLPDRQRIRERGRRRVGQARCKARDQDGAHRGRGCTHAVGGHARRGTRHASGPAGTRQTPARKRDLLRPTPASGSEQHCMPREPSTIPYRLGYWPDATVRMVASGAMDTHASSRKFD